jgi:hypothetical protein
VSAKTLSQLSLDVDTKVQELADSGGGLMIISRFRSRRSHDVQIPEGGTVRLTGWGVRLPGVGVKLGSWMSRRRRCTRGTGCATRRCGIERRWKDSAAGQSQLAGEAEGSRDVGTHATVGAVLTTYGRVGTVRWPGSGKQ